MCYRRVQLSRLSRALDHRPGHLHVRSQPGQQMTSLILQDDLVRGQSQSQGQGKKVCLCSSVSTAYTVKFVVVDNCLIATSIHQVPSQGKDNH